MIVRLKWCVCCVLVIIVPFVLSPISTNAAAVTQLGETTPKSAPTIEPLIGNIPHQANDPGSSPLRLSKNAGPETVAPGDFVSYDLTVANTSSVSTSGVRLLDILPAGFMLKKGSVRLNGVSAPDPAVSTDGKVLTFSVGDLPPASSSTISFMVETAVDSTPGKVVNLASAISSDGGRSNIAKEIVTVGDDLQRTKVAADITPVVPRETLQPLTVKSTGVTTSAADAETISSQAAATSGQAAPPVPPTSDSSLRSAPQTAPTNEKPQAAVTQAGEATPRSVPTIEPLNIPSQANDPGSSRLRVSKNAGPETVAPGEFVNYDLTVANISSVGASGVRLLDILPAGFMFKNGSVRFNGISAPDPTISTDGKVLTFSVGDLPSASSSTISFIVETAVGSTPGKVVNLASAISSDGGRSNIAKEIVTVRDDLQQSKAAADLTVAAPQETLQPLAVKGSGVITPATDSGAIASQAAVTSGQTANPSPDSSLQPVPPESPDNEEELQTDDLKVDDFVVQKTQSLAELIGMADISVLSDVGGQFVKNMAENQTLKNEFASQVVETNLLESIRVGRSFNRESRAALARTEQASAQTGQSLALLLPTISVSANRGFETSVPNVATDATGNLISQNTPNRHIRTDASLSVRQALFDLPSFMDWQRRKVVEQARGENYRVSDGDAYISAVNAYLSIVSSRLQTDMTREFETKLNDLLIYVEKRAKAGAASNSDMARVRARSQATLSSRLEQESAHAAAGIEFIRLTNLVPNKVRLPALDDIGASLLPKTMDLAVKSAMKSNPEIAALNADIEAADIDKLVAKGRFLPRIDAEYTNSYSLHAGGSTSAAGQKDQRLMMVLNWSLFSGGSDYQTHVERVARHTELQYRLDDQRRRVVQSLSANYATLATTRERITSGYQELKSISTAAEAMSKRMLSGNQSLLDMLDVYDRLYQVRSRLVSLHILEMSTAAQLVRLMHGTPGAGTEVKAVQSK